jgi:hypothetical protein
MHFGMKNTLKSNRNHTPKQAHHFYRTLTSWLEKIHYYYY